MLYVNSQRLCRVTPRCSALHIRLFDSGRRHESQESQKIYQIEHLELPAVVTPWERGRSQN